MELVKVQESEFSLLSGEEYCLPNQMIIHLLHLASRELPDKEPDFAEKFSEICNEQLEGNSNDFDNWYSEQKSDSLSEEVERMSKVLILLKKEIHKINRSDIENYCRNQLVTDSWIGEEAKEGILKKVAQERRSSYKTGEKDSSIDGYIGEQPVMIKPYQRNCDTSEDEVSHAATIFYKINRDGLELFYEFSKH